LIPQKECLCAVPTGLLCQSVESAFPTLKRGASKHCASGALIRTQEGPARLPRRKKARRDFQDARRPGAITKTQEGPARFPRRKKARRAYQDARRPGAISGTQEGPAQRRFFFGARKSPVPESFWGRFLFESLGGRSRSNAMKLDRVSDDFKVMKRRGF
jgi:hypothetical protein